jgi:hypothetical protein
MFVGLPSVSSLSLVAAPGELPTRNMKTSSNSAVARGRKVHLRKSYAPTLIA